MRYTLDRGPVDWHSPEFDDSSPVPSKFSHLEPYDLVEALAGRDHDEEPYDDEEDVEIKLWEDDGNFIGRWIAKAEYSIDWSVRSSDTLKYSIGEKDWDKAIPVEQRLLDSRFLGKRWIAQEIAIQRWVLEDNHGPASADVAIWSETGRLKGYYRVTVNGHAGECGGEKSCRVAHVMKATVTILEEVDA